MNNFNTSTSIEYIVNYFKSKNVDTINADWSLTKKYKNFKGQVCRDLVNLNLKLRAILITNVDNLNPIVIENENYEFFLKEVVNTPVFYYAPVICNAGLLYVFVPSAYFDTYGSIPSDINSQKSILSKKLLSLFKEDLFSVGESLYFAFPNSDMEDVIRKLEKNQMTFNEKVFSLLDKEHFQLIIPDTTLSSFRFPEDELLSGEQSIDLIFKILSTSQNFNNEIYARIKSLLKKVKVEDFNIVRYMGLGFVKDYDLKLVSIFDYEANRKKAQKLVRQIWLEKVKNI